MVKGVVFKNENFNEEFNELLELTKNTVILCDNCHTKALLSTTLTEYITRRNDDAFDINNDCGDYTIEVCYKPTTILKVGKQRIIITTEAPFILQCKNIKDLWFCQMNNNEEICLNALTDYKGYKLFWKKGKDYVYKMYISGQFGDYAYGN